MNDELILVDIHDKEIGYGDKETVHKKGQLHRAFSVFLIDKDKMLIQKRAHSKYHSGGLWSNSCCSHPRRGEELLESVKRRLHEEIGVYCDTKKIGYIVYHKKFGEELYEYEYDHIFVGEYDKNNFIINKDEVEEVKWIGIKELEKDILVNPNKYSVWFLGALSMVLNHKKIRRK